MNPGVHAMSKKVISIKRYPNRRYYARNISKYVSLQEIEAMVQGGSTVEICDSQTGEDLTAAVLTQIIMDRHPEKISLFPTDMLHLMLRSNQSMSNFLRDYLRNSVSFLDFLQRHSPAPTALVQPMHWFKSWLDAVTPSAGKAEATPSGEPAALRDRLKQLEERLAQLEAKKSDDS